MSDRLPTFVVIGAMKGGTTSLAAYLAGHPDVFMSSPKEPRYFTKEWERGREWYESLFEAGRTAAARGEASTDYTKAPQVEGAPARLAQVVPDAKLLYLVRNPVDRIRSHYVHRSSRYVETKIERRPLDVAVRHDPMYLDWTRYGAQLDRYLEHFPREQLLVVSSERLRTSRRETLAEVFEFIGVDPHVDVPDLDRELNRGAGKRRIPQWVRPMRAVLWRLGIFGRMTPHQRKSLQRRLQRERIRAEMPAELEEWIWQELDDDLHRLRKIVGPDFDLWGRVP